MNGCSDITDILNQSMKELFQKLGGTVIRGVPVTGAEDEDLYTLSVTTSGDYCLTIDMCAQVSVFEAVVQYMRHGEATREAEILPYITEFFNVLCGRIISNYNRVTHLSARFGIPVLQKGRYCHKKGQVRFTFREYNYECSYGGVKIITYFKSPDENRV